MFWATLSAYKIFKTVQKGFAFNTQLFYSSVVSVQAYLHVLSSSFYTQQTKLSPIEAVKVHLLCHRTAQNVLFCKNVLFT